MAYIIAGSFGVSLMIGSLFLSIGLLIKFLRGAHAKVQPRSVPDALPAANAKALEVYRDLAREKLEVIKTALAMGYKDDEIAALDARLEKVIGKDKLESLLRGGGEKVMADADLLDTALDREIARLQKIRQK